MNEQRYETAAQGAFYGYIGIMGTVLMIKGTIAAAIFFVAVFGWRIYYLLNEKKKSRERLVGYYVHWKEQKIRIRAYQIIGDKYILANGEKLSSRTVHSLTKESP